MKRKFVKVMLFGALTLATGASFVGCKDYDDDVKNLQEQIDKITSTSPVSTEDMKAAIVAAKAELQAEVDKLKASAADKTAITALETKIAELKAALEKADSDAAAKIAADLTKAQNELKDLISGNTNKITALETQIAKLGGIETRLKALEDAKNDYLKTGALDAYTKTEDMAALINSQIAASLGSNGAIAAYVENAIKTQALADASALSTAISGITGKDGSLTKLQEAFDKAMNDDKTGVLKRLHDLELYNQGIDDAIANSEGKYEDFADVLKSLKALEDNYASLIVPAEFAKTVDAALTESLKDANSEFSKLTAEVKKLGIDIEALKAMIQSVVFVPEYADGQVQFTSLYALKNQPVVAWQPISKSDAVEVKFRISPVTAATKFLEKYTISVDAQEIKTSRAVAPFDIVEGGTTVDAATGMMTIKLKANTEKSYAVSLNIKSKASENTDVATDINSNYFPVVSIENYLHSAYYKLAVSNKVIIYDDQTSNADYSTGKVVVNVSTDGNIANASEKDFSSLGVSNIFGTEFTVTNTPIFKISSAGVVALKTYGQASSVNEAGAVSATVKLTNTAFKMTPDPKTLGTVTVKKATSGKDVDFGTKQVEWKNTAITLAATEFDINAICNKNNITKNEFAALTGTVTPGDVKFVVGTDNALTATVVAGKKAGEYPIEVAFTNADQSLSFKVTATVKVVYPNVITLTPDPYFWAGTPASGTVGLTPTLSDDTKPATIGLAYDLTKLFSNYIDVKNAIPAGGSLVISVATTGIPGVSYNNATSTLTYDKDAFTGYLADGTTKAVVKVKAVVSLGAEAIQTLNATINIINISGTWVAPATKAVTLNDKAAVVDLSKGFKWNDLRGKTMWADATTVVGGDDFAATTNALALYGLQSPTFVLFDKTTNQVITSEYLTLNPTTGKISFTQAGKNFNFVQDYVITVKVVASSQWGAISNYSGNEYITVTIPKN